MANATRPKRIAIVTASRGTLINHVLGQPGFRRHIAGVIADRPCGALDRARDHGLPAALIEEKNNQDLSDRIEAWCRDNRIDYILSIFSRLFVGRLLDSYDTRIFNLHPSLLPAFPGMGSYDKALRSGVRIIGSTLHVVDATTDGGPILMQTAHAVPYGDVKSMRHQLFVAECKMLLQVVSWLAQDRVLIGPEGAKVAGAGFGDATFSPALDDPEAINFQINEPG